ncbi:MAG: TonB-dependent receptor, partial [Acidobacteriota bacterium]|nr:TonB-dependent receptor [Acidobacteriota bacterium]
TVTVESRGVQMVNTANAEISGLVNNTTIENLPLEIRDATAFVNLQPGAVPDVFNGSTRGAAVNGQRGGTGNFMVDGTDNNDYGQGGRGHNTIGTLPGGITSISPDAVQEFRVVTNNFSAQYGRQGGFETDIVLKSGKNQIHGSAFEYNRNSATTANDFFSNKAGLSDQLIRNQFGGSFGGPIKKDTAWFYGAAEIQRLRQTTPVTGTALRQSFVDFVNNGGFAKFVNQNLASFGLSAPIGCKNPANYGCTLAPIFKQLDSKFPLPRANGPVSPSDYLSTSPIFSNPNGSPIAYPVPMFGQATYSARNTLNENRWSLKYDHRLSSKDTLSAHYLFDDYDSFFGGTGGDFFNPAFNSFAPARSQQAAIEYTRIISPSVVNDFNFAYLRNNAGFPAQDPQIPSIGTIDALSFGFGTTSSLPQNFTENTFQYQDNLAIIHGRHSFTVGGEYRRTRNGSEFDANFDGLYEIWDTEDLLTDGAIGDMAGMGGFYRGEAAINPSSLTPAKPNPYRGYRANELDWYVQDDWKATNTLTLNLGLRYDYFGVPHNYRPNIDSNFYFGSPILSQCIRKNSNGKQVCLPGSGVTTPVSTNPYYPVNPATAAVFSAVFQVRNSEIWNKDTNNFAPRFGLAWDVRGDQKTVIRMGGGIFYDRIWNNLFENIRFNPPYFAFSQVGLFFNGQTPGPISDPGFYSIPISVANFAGAGATPSPRQMDQNLVTPYSEQVNFDVQRQLTPSWLLDVAYVGTFGHKLTGVADLNTFDGRTVPGKSHSRINPNIGGDNARGNYYNSNYSSLQARITKRFSHGLQFNGNYTWSHALDYISDAFNNKAAGSFDPEDTYNRRLEYGNADFDIRHRFVADWVWDIPFFHSNRILSGWSLNGILEWQTGSPFTVYDSAVDSNFNGIFNDRAAFLGTGNISSAINHNVSPADGYLNPKMFGPTQSSSRVPVDGMLARNALFGPGYFNNDLSIAKDIRIRERATLRIQVSAFNVWNKPNFIMASAESNVSNTVFGQAQGTVQPNNSGTGSRVLQFGAHLEF